MYYPRVLLTMFMFSSFRFIIYLLYSSSGLSVMKYGFFYARCDSLQISPHRPLTSHTLQINGDYIMYSIVYIYIFFCVVWVFNHISFYYINSSAILTIIKILFEPFANLQTIDITDAVKPMYSKPVNKITIFHGYSKTLNKYYSTSTSIFFVIQY